MTTAALGLGTTGRDQVGDLDHQDGGLDHQEGDLDLDGGLETMGQAHMGQLHLRYEDRL